MGWLSGRRGASGGGRSGWFFKGPGGPSTRSDGPAMKVDNDAVKAHFAAFAASRRGVEAYVEPPTNVTSTTVVLIAIDGEWTRRAVRGRDAGFEVARSLNLPVYDVNQTGYPSRMREWNSRQRKKS